MDLNLRNVWPRVRWQAERLGQAGKAGLALTVFSIVFFVAAVLPRWAESEALMEKAEAMQAALGVESVPERSGGSAQQKRRPKRKIRGDEALQAFYAFFPKIDSSPLWIRELVQVAEERGVEISGTEYRLVRGKDLKLARYEMVLPVRARYPELRGFIADALRVVPAMALVDVAIKREGVESELLEANLKFNLYLREGRN
jgi:hypothetical protein